MMRQRLPVADVQLDTRPPQKFVGVISGPPKTKKPDFAGLPLDLQSKSCLVASILGLILYHICMKTCNSPGKDPSASHRDRIDHGGGHDTVRWPI
jgi:hypothetical protein